MMRVTMETCPAVLLAWTSVAVLALVTTTHAQQIMSLGPQVHSNWDYSGPIQGARKVFLMQDEFPSRGVLFSFLAYFKNSNPVHLQIWRPTLFGLRYELVFDWRYLPQTDDHYKRTAVELTGNACTMVQRGDRVGFMNEEEMGPIGHEFVPQGLRVLFFTLSNDSLPVQGDDVTFDPLQLPYLFALTAVYDQDAAWYDRNPGETCRGLQAPPEPTTSVAPPVTTPDYRGPAGPIGPPGVAGPPGPNGPAGPRGLTGAPGPAGSKGGVGKDGPLGPPGLKGDTGVTGAIGPEGGIGPAGPPGQRGLPGKSDTIGGNTGGGLTAAATGTCNCESGLLNTNVILGLIVWLLLLTLLVIVLLVLMTKRNKDATKAKKSESFRTLPRESPWMDTLREDQWKEYAVETISNPH